MQNETFPCCPAQPPLPADGCWSFAEQNHQIKFSGIRSSGFVSGAGARRVVGRQWGWQPPPHPGHIPATLIAWGRGSLCLSSNPSHADLFFPCVAPELEGFCSISNCCRPALQPGIIRALLQRCFGSELESTQRIAHTAARSEPGGGEQLQIHTWISAPFRSSQTSHGKQHPAVG